MICTLKYLLILYAIFLAGCSPFKKDNNKLETSLKSDTLISIENDSTKLTFSLWGGALVSFQDKILRVNPFSWKEAHKDTAENSKNSAVLQGQFISLGRWSLPTIGESKLGMPLNGEPANNWWKLEPSKTSKDLKMSCEAPLDGFSITRYVVISQTAPLFKVTETITNENSTGRSTSIVQNITLVPPFFEPSVVINSNASVGFNQLWGLSNPGKFEYNWPKAYVDTLKIGTTDISSFSNRFRYLSSHVFPDSIGWFTLYNPKLKLLLGYVWKTSDYPWIHFKNEINYGKPLIHGLAFGSAGLSDKFPFEERTSMTFHGVRNFDFIDAKSSITKSWYCFLLNTPSGYQKVLDVSFSADQLVLHVLSYSNVNEIKLSL